MQDPTMKFEYSTTVRMHEAGPDGLAPVQVLLRYFQEAAGVHAERLSWGKEALQEHNLAWVLVRLGVVIHRLPTPGESVKVQTWPVSSVKYKAKRDFRMLDGQGEALATGASNWVMMDVDARRMCSIPAKFAEMFAQVAHESVYEFADKKLPAPALGESACEIVARLEDLDLNGHVNNPHFAAWALEAVAQEHARTHRLTGMDIQFRFEVRRAERLLSLCDGRAEQEGVLLHSLRRQGDEVEVARARTLWAAL